MQNELYGSVSAEVVQVHVSRKSKACMLYHWKIPQKHFSSRSKIVDDFPYYSRLTSSPLGQSLKSYDPYKPSIQSPPVREISERSY